MVKYTNEELLEILPPSLRESKELTPKQKVVLGQLVIYNGLEIVKKDGYFYRSNKDLSKDCDIEERTLITAVNKLVMLGFIERERGSRKDGASMYRINQKMIADYCRTPIDDNCKKETDNYSNDYSKQIVEMTNRIKELEITVKRLVERITVIESGNYSTDTESDKDIEIDKDNIYNNINKKNNIPDNIIEIFEKLENMNKLVRELEQRVNELERENKQLSSILESKDNKNSSINNNNSLQLKKETNTKLEEENSNSTPTVTAAKVETKKESTKGKSINEKIDILLQRMESINSLEEFSIKLHQAEEWFIKQGFHTSQREAEPEVVYFIANSQKIYNRLSSIEEEKKKELEEIAKQSFPICASEDDLIKSLVRGHQTAPESVSDSDDTNTPIFEESVTIEAVAPNRPMSVRTPTNSLKEKVEEYLVSMKSCTTNEELKEMKEMFNQFCNLTGVSKSSDEFILFQSEVTKIEEELHQRLSEASKSVEGTNTPTKRKSVTSKATDTNNDLTVMDYSEWFEKVEENLPF